MENSEKKFNPLLEKNGSLYVNLIKKFQPIFSVNEYISDVVAWSISQKHFKANGRTRENIIKNAIVGKFGEFAIYKFLKSLNYELEKPDLGIKGKGEWDEGDLFLNQKKIQVKTSSYKSNLLLIRSSDWDENGNYKYSKEKNFSYDAFFYCRMKPDINLVLDLKEEKDYNIDLVTERLLSVNFRFDIPGFINRSDFLNIIKKNMLLNKETTVNGFKMHDNYYYCQSGDLRDIDSIPKKR